MTTHPIHADVSMICETMHREAMQEWLDGMAQEEAAAYEASLADE